MRTVYIDTGAFIALIWRRDRAHQRARAHLLALRRQRDRLVTSEAVIAETTTRLRHDAGLPAVAEFRRILDSAVARGELSIRYGDERLRARAFDVMAQFAALMLSYADCVGIAVAREARADAVFGFDDDFRAAGLAVEPAPA